MDPLAMYSILFTVALMMLHPSIAIGKDAKKIPETVQFYNSTKCGADIETSHMTAPTSVQLRTVTGELPPMKRRGNMANMVAGSSWPRPLHSWPGLSVLHRRSAGPPYQLPTRALFFESGVFICPVLRNTLSASEQQNKSS
ncbi:UNVERIFIED_CONTAM: hypothetical protein FKN15_022652 [Acipenser sinensis]